MASDRSTDDSAFGQDHKPDGDAQAQAALLLVESLIHSLIDTGTLSKQQAIDTISSAFEVKEESEVERKEPELTRRRSMALLSMMRNSVGAHSGPYQKAPDQDPGQADG